MALSRAARPGKPLEPPRVMARPWSGHSQRLSKGDVSLCFKGSIAEDCGRGAVLLQGQRYAGIGVFFSLTYFPVLGNYVPVALPSAGSFLRFPAGANTSRPLYECFD